ncbi:S8 family serine peptidase [Asanoa sp. WMMD1127]|uniref:S8 family peptidase n=1 Tax=Asanoa sp. WMMD1127 TaxID=3016107 RepID=UPI002415B2E2|nr:S8 family serine peptidase [Asanoa sp. WMMD1127]MDG4821976.1 S8 family serine peptidase [Asanoa sp. WMMD1127]
MAGYPQIESYPQPTCGVVPRLAPASTLGARTVTTTYVRSTAVPDSDSGGEMKQSKDRRSRARWFAAVPAMVMVATIPLLAGPAHADTVRSLSWHLDALKIPRAQQITKGAGVTVAVIDSGVQANHQDLVGQVVPGKGFGSDSSADGRTDPDKSLSHGTAIASLIVGRGGGQQRMLGIAPQAKVMPASVGTDATTMPEAIRWAADQRPGVINISMGVVTPGFGPEFRDAIAYAQQRDIVVVASAGNEGKELGEIAGQPGVVAVAASNRNGKLWEDSGWGPGLAVTAPGVDVIMSVNASTSPNGYGVATGTSGAAAITAGVVALIRSRFPELDAANVINRLVKTATDKGEKGQDGHYGFGIIDPVKALTADVPPVNANPLGAVDPLPSDTASAPAADDDSVDSGSGLGIKVHADPGGLLLYGLGCLAVVAAIVVLIVWSSRRRRRRPAYPGPSVPGGPPPMPPGNWGGSHPPGHRAHYPPPHPGYGPPPPPPGYQQAPSQPGQTPPWPSGPVPARPRPGGGAMPPGPYPPASGRPTSEQRQPPPPGDR